MRNRVTYTRQTLASLAAAAVLLAGCGTNSDGDDGSEKASSTAFPATVEGRYGSVTVEKVPIRVVALSAPVAEMLHALGVAPVVVAASDDEIEQFSPWLEGRFELDPELVVSRETNLEKVAAYDPDLVIGYGAAVPEDVYEQMQDITATYILGTDDEPNPPWEKVITDLATLTGTDAGPVIDSVEQLCKDSRERLPQWQGRTYQFVAAGAENLEFGNGTALECLGLVPAGNQTNLNDGSGITYENIDELDADFVMVWDYTESRARIEADPRYAALPAVRSEALIWESFASATVSAINSPDGPSSFGFLIEQLGPTLEATTPAP